jgi:hypothetical protein
MMSSIFFLCNVIPFHGGSSFNRFKHLEKVIGVVILVNLTFLVSFRFPKILSPTFWSISSGIVNFDSRLNLRLLVLR